MRRDTQVLTGCALGIFAAAIEGTVVGTIMPTVVGELGGLDLYGWVFAVYLMASAVSMPLWGKLSDQYGAKRFFMAGMVFFMVGSAFAGTSRSIEPLIAFRLIQGLGAGALVSIGLTLLGNHFPPEKRGHATGIAASVWGFSAMIGPPVGALIVETIGWRWAFYVNIPVGVAAIWLIARSYRDPQIHHRHRLDIMGATTLMAAITSILLAAQSFKEGTTYLGLGPSAWIVAAAALILAWIHIERRAEEPIVPLPLFRKRVFLVANSGGFLMTFCVFTAIAFVPLLLQRGDPGNVLRAGGALIPLSLGWTMGSAGGGRIVDKIGGRTLGRFGALSMALGFTLARTFTSTTSGLKVVPVMLLIGLGMGTTSPAFLVTLQNHLGGGRMGVVTSGMMFWRNLGGTLGVTLLGVFVPGESAGLQAITAGAQHAFMAAAVIAFSVVLLVQGLPRSIMPAPHASGTSPSAAGDPRAKARPHPVSIPDPRDDVRHR